MTGYHKKEPETELSEEDLRTVTRLREELDTLEKRAAITGRSVREFLISMGYNPSIIEIVLAKTDEQTEESEYAAFVPAGSGKYVGVRKGVGQDSIFMEDQELREFFDKDAKDPRKPLTRTTKIALGVIWLLGLVGVSSIGSNLMGEFGVEILVTIYVVASAIIAYKHNL
jgi:hypothetical protein